MNKKELEQQVEEFSRLLDLLVPHGTMKTVSDSGFKTYIVPTTFLLEKSKNFAEETELPMVDNPNIASESISVNKRAEILHTAEELINGDRAQTYGPPEISFGKIADIWNAMGYRIMMPQTADPETEPHIPGNKIFYKANKLDAVDAALLLIGMKLSRTVGARDHEDNWVDLAGYAGLGAELAIKEMAPETHAVSEYLQFVWEPVLSKYVCVDCSSPVDREAIDKHYNMVHPKFEGYRVTGGPYVSFASKTLKGE